jgi:hypothetical protein
VAITSKEKKKNCCVDGPVIAELRLHNVISQKTELFILFCSTITYTAQIRTPNYTKTLRVVRIGMNAEVSGGGYCGVFLAELRKTTKIVCQDSRSPIGPSSPVIKSRHDCVDLKSEISLRVTHCLVKGS